MRPANARLIGVVINEVDFGDTGYGGYYSYYYRTYGHYGGYSTTEGSAEA
jgi:Mrp family chromosome partitioning ATPase